MYYRLIRGSINPPRLLSVRKYALLLVLCEIGLLSQVSMNISEKLLL